MFIRRPKLMLSGASSSLDLIADAFSQYHVALGDNPQRQLHSLQMDDIDLVEAIELVEAAIGARISREALRPSATLAELATLFDEARSSQR